MATLTISQKSGLGTVKQIISFVRSLGVDIIDIKVTKAGTVKFFSDRLSDLSDELKWQTKGVEYDPSNGSYWLPKKSAKRWHTLPRWEKL